MPNPQAALEVTHGVQRRLHVAAWLHPNPAWLPIWCNVDELVRCNLSLGTALFLACATFAHFQANCQESSHHDEQAFAQAVYHNTHQMWQARAAA